MVSEAESHGVELLGLSDALERVEPVEGRELAPSSWGVPKDLTTWDSPRVAELVVAARRAELEVVGAVNAARRGSAQEESGAGGLERAARELLALQSSDWAFLETRELAADYSLERARGHARGVDAALAAAVPDCAAEPDPTLRNLAPELDLSPLLAP